MLHCGNSIHPAAGRFRSGSSSNTPMKVFFYWQWELTRPQPDPLMTRERAARLLRAWRRAKVQGKRVFSLRCVRVRQTRAYLVQHVATGESAGLYIHSDQSFPDAAHGKCMAPVLGQGLPLSAGREPELVVA